MTHTLIYTKITKVVAVAGLVLAACLVSALAAPAKEPRTAPGQASSRPTQASDYDQSRAQQTTTSPAPQPSGMPVCDDLTEIGGDLATLQNGPTSNAPQELQALGVQLSKVGAETSQQSSDLGVLIQDFNTEVTDTSDGTTLGTSLDPNAAVDGDSRMDNDFNALMSDCGDS